MLKYHILFIKKYNKFMFFCITFIKAIFEIYYFLIFVFALLEALLLLIYTEKKY